MTAPYFHAYAECQPKNHASQLETIKNIMLDGQWHDKYSIAEQTGIELSSVASRIRDLRLEKFGGYTIKRTKQANKDVYFYRLTKPEQGRLFDECNK